jgi:hypothetical protein
MPWVRAVRPTAGRRLTSVVRHALVLLVFLSIPLLASGQQPQAAEPPPRQVVAAYFKAYNAHDLDTVMSFIDPQIVWYTVTPDNTVVEVDGVTALRDGLVKYFKALPSSRSEGEVLGENGPWVSVRETAKWQSAPGPRAQTSLSVYELRNGKIRRVWYYPAVRP